MSAAIFCSVGVKIAVISVVLGVVAINTFAIIRSRVVGSGPESRWLVVGRLTNCNREVVLKVQHALSEGILLCSMRRISAPQEATGGPRRPQ